MSLAEPKNQVLLFIPLGALALYLLAKEPEPETEIQVTAVAVAVVTESASGNGKEANFLRFNNDSIYGNLLATEEHFRNIKEDVNFNQCAAKHLSLISNHADEAVSHSVALGQDAESKQYAEIRVDSLNLQHDTQAGKVSSAEGIRRVRAIRAKFEALNPAFDVSKCKACKVE